MKYNHITYTILVFQKYPVNIVIIILTLLLKIPRFKLAKKYCDHISHSKKWKNQVE